MPINQHFVDVSQCWSDTGLLETVASELARVVGNGSRVRRVYFDGLESFERFREALKQFENERDFIEDLNEGLPDDFPAGRNFNLHFSTPEEIASSPAPYLEYVPIKIPKS